MLKKITLGLITSLLVTVACVGLAAASITVPTVTLPNADTILPAEGGASPGNVASPAGYVVSTEFTVSWNGVGGGTGAASFKVKGPTSFTNGGNGDTKPASEVWVRKRKPNNQWDDWVQMSASGFAVIDPSVNRNNDSRSLQICVRASFDDTVNGTNQQFVGTLTWEVI